MLQYFLNELWNFEGLWNCASQDKYLKCAKLELQFFNGDWRKRLRDMSDIGMWKQHNKHHRGTRVEAGIMRHCL